MICEKCQKEHNGSYGSGRFCSGYCARSYAAQKTPEIRQKISRKLKNNQGLLESNAARKGKTVFEIFGEERGREIIEKQRRSNRESRVLIDPFTSGSDGTAAKRELLKEGHGCHGCGNIEWMGQPIPLELHHINGNNLDQSRKNIQLLCPNCHALTDNFRARNKKMVRKVTDIELVQAITDHKLNIRQALIQVGLSARGGNYKRCYQLIQSNNLDIPL